MGAWMCPRCEHGKFFRPYKNMTIMCARPGCSFTERTGSRAGIEKKREHKNK